MIPAPEGEPSDGELVRKTLDGERAAFGGLVRRYERIIGVLAFQKVGNAADAEDVAQEAFLKAYAALGELLDADRFGSWLYGIAFRVAIDHLRRRIRRGPMVSIDAAEEPGDPRAGHDAERQETSERVQAAVGALPDKYRLVLTLRYQKHMSYQEIAAHLGEPAGTVANRIHRAAKMMRAALEGVEGLGVKRP